VLDGIKGVGYRWDKVGDDLDAISICMNMPTRIFEQGSSNKVLALTDRIGRHANGEVFAWTGILFGNESESAYRAMSAIFLQPGEAWLFNGYGTEAPYDTYTMYPAESALKRVRISPETFHPPRNSVSDWRRATRRPIDAGYIHVNTAGHRDWFDLHPGRAYTADIPFMDKPAMVYFTHSFSAQDVDDKGSIARRWLDNGVYAYIGAVDEPFLPAFTPPVYVAQGLLTPLPWAVMARPNSDKPWKINVFGDPLITLGPVPKRTDRIPKLPGSKSLDDVMKKALSEKDYVSGISQMVMLGRDADVARLAKAILTQDPRALTPELAMVMLPVFYQSGRADLYTKCYLTIEPEQRADVLIIDMTWKALGPELEATRNEEVLDAMTGIIREATFVEDVSAVANAIRRLRGNGAAIAFLTRLERTEGISSDRKRFLQRQMDRIQPPRN